MNEEVFEETLTVTIVQNDAIDGLQQEQDQEEYEQENEEVHEVEYAEHKSSSPDSHSNATENVLYQEIPMKSVRTYKLQHISPPQCVDDYAEPQLMITSPQPSIASSGSVAAIPISTNGSPLYAQVHKEPRTEIQKIHSTIPNTFKNDNLGCMLTTFGTKTPSMTSFGTPMSSLGAMSSGASGGGGGAWNKQMLAASYSNDLNSSKDSMLGSLDMLSDSGNHSDSWMYPQASGGAAGGAERGHRKKGGRAPPSSFTDQLNQVLADRERCVG